MAPLCSAPGRVCNTVTVGAPQNIRQKTQQSRRRRRGSHRSLRHASSSLLWTCGVPGRKGHKGQTHEARPVLGDREGAEAPGTMFQGLPVISDCTGRAHPLGRGFAHLTGEPAPLGHRQRVDHVHGAAGGVGLQDGCLASIRKAEVSRDNHGPARTSGFQGQGGGAGLTATIGEGRAQTLNLKG
jgi:hypothetical protein